jgi:hypothetical protein
MGPPIWISGLFFNFVMYLKWLSSEFLFSGELSPKFPIVQGLATSINEKKLEKNGLFAIKLNFIINDAK